MHASLHPFNNKKYFLMDWTGFTYEIILNQIKFFKVAEIIIKDEYF